jgi:hypothetical protein
LRYGNGRKQLPSYRQARINSQLTLTGLSAFPELQCLETRIGDFAFIEVLTAKISSLPTNQKLELWQA